MNEITDALSYDASSGEFRWLATRGKAIRGQAAGTPQVKGYTAIRFAGKTYLAHRLAWFFVHRRWPANQIDHINGDKADNRLANLREATNQQNHANRGAQRNSTSGVKGVYWFKPQNKWKAQICVNKRAIVIGYFATKDEAIAARKAAEEIYHGNWKHEGAPTIAYGP